jgi:hypothetical protein
MSNAHVGKIRWKKLRSFASLPTLYRTFGESDVTARRIAFASLATWIEIVSKRLNHMVGRNSDVRCSSLHHRENGSKHAAYRTNLLSTGIFG